MVPEQPEFPTLRKIKEGLRKYFSKRVCRVIAWRKV